MALLVAVSLASAALGHVHAAGVPGPAVTAKIAASLTTGDPAHDYPFYASTVDLASRGCVEKAGHILRVDGDTTIAGAERSTIGAR